MAQKRMDLARRAADSLADAHAYMCDDADWDNVLDGNHRAIDICACATAKTYRDVRQAIAMAYAEMARA